MQSKNGSVRDCETSTERPAKSFDVVIPTTCAPRDFNFGL